MYMYLRNATTFWKKYLLFVLIKKSLNVEVVRYNVYNYVSIKF